MTHGHSLENEKTGELEEEEEDMEADMEAQHGPFGDPG